MKIAFVTAFYRPAVDGPGNVIWEIGQRLAKQGHDVHVFCSDSDKKNTIKEKEAVEDGIKIHRLNNWFIAANFATFFPSVLKRLWKEDFDIIHSHVSGHSYHFFSALISRLKKVPHVHTTHCCWTTGFRSRFARLLVWLDYRTVLPLSFHWSDKIIAITPWELNQITKWGGKKDKIIVIPNGMDSILFKKVAPNKFKKDLGIPKDKKVVLFFGRKNPVKGVSNLLKAEQEILKEREDCYFVFVGPDEGEEHLIESAAKTNNKIINLGPIYDKTKIAEMYQGSDIYVLPSYREGLPLTLFEAMASGLPIVATPVNGVPYEMKDPDNGLLVQYGDVKALKDAIVKLLDDDGLRQKISANNIEHAKKYDWDIIAEKTLGVYESLLK
ncbi:glycosyltransferase family 1 protein [Candidatus Woesearchaeota archaeon]|nr:MAG: glycosyltransferase family 1 protein [Candidatus Woesearchaeota archaeon]